MGDTSELGPVDPQIPVAVGGIFRYLPAQSFIDSMDELVDKANQAQLTNQPAQGYGALLSTVNVAFVNEARRQIAHATQMGERWLVKAMYPQDQAKAAEIMGKLTAANVHQSHGRMIDAWMARDNIGLKVRILQSRSQLWRQLWRLHLVNELWMSQTLPMNQSRVKLFESANVSLAQHAPVS